MEYAAEAGLTSGLNPVGLFWVVYNAGNEPLKVMEMIPCASVT